LGKITDICPMDIRFHLQDIRSSAVKFWLAFSRQKIFAFHGGMGAGKTTFIHALCDVKGVLDTVGSPTFSIINEYRFPGGKIFHIDLYRLRDEEEALRAGVEDTLYSGEICLVEWPDRAPGIFPPETVELRIEVLDPDTRRIYEPPPANHNFKSPNSI
jgi:tRNA threonylcarbamoyladenosine biosynthesis protein TsaE